MRVMHNSVFMEVRLRVRLQRKVTRKTKNKVYYHYYITLPAKVVETLGLEKYVNKEIEIILKV